MAAKEFRIPHPDTILYRPSTGETKALPTGRARDVAQDIADAKFDGYHLAVPVIKTASGTRRNIIIEDVVGGVTGLAKVLRSKRRVGTGDDTQYIDACMLVGDWNALSQAQREAMLEKSTKRADPRDAVIAQLQAELASMKAVQAPPPAAPVQQGKGR